jgi:hypothetical protein
MLQNQRRLACALLLGICVGTTAVAAGQSCDPGEALEHTVQISAGGPYVAKAGSPITLRGEYIVAGQTENSDRLKIIGRALQAYAQDHGSYPPAALLNRKGQPTVSWRVLILPYLGEKDLYERFDLTKPWDDPVNLRLLREMPAVYLRSDPFADRTETGFAGVEGVGSLFQNASAQLNGGRKLSGISATEKIAAGPVGAGGASALDGSGGHRYQECAPARFSSWILWRGLCNHAAAIPRRHGLSRTGQCRSRPADRVDPFSRP